MKTPELEVGVHLPCPCGKSSDAFSRYVDGQGHCFSCGKHYKGAMAQEEEKVNTLTEMPASDTVGAKEPQHHFEYIARRGISKEAHEFYDVKAKINSTTGEPVSVEYPYRGGHGGKVRSTQKKEFWARGDMRTPGCFGMERFPAGSAKAITITEGEDDTLAVRTMMGNYPCISIRGASSAIADVRADFDKINSFDKIYLCLDSDEPGRKAANEIANIFGFKKVYNVKCAPYKDAQDFLEKGQAQSFKNTWFNADRFLPEGVVSSFNQTRKIFADTKQFTRWATPFSELNWMLGGGLEVHRSYLVSGLTGIGKTEFFRAIQHKLITETDANVAILHFEEPIKETVQRAVSYELKTPVHMEESHVSDDTVLETWEKLVKRDDRVHFLQHYGSEDPDVILAKIRFFVAACGCQYVFLDNITVLGTGRVQDDERKELDYLSTQLEMLVKELPFCLVLISHENEHEGTRGSQNINKVMDVWINLKRDIKSENPFEQTILKIYLNKNRQASRTGNAGKAQYDLSTGVLSEVTNELLA